MIWFTADHHFGHVGQYGRPDTGIIKYVNRPFKDVHEMGAELVRRWNERVALGDVVVYLGDLTLATRPDVVAEVVRPLNGVIYLIRGNHDRASRRTYVSLGIMYLGRHAWWGRTLLVHNPSKASHFDGPTPQALLCGHVHIAWKYSGICRNVGVDVNDFYPVSLDTLVDEGFIDAPGENFSPDFIRPAR